MEPIKYEPTISDKVKDILFIAVLTIFSIYVTLKLAHALFFHVSHSPWPGGNVLGYIFLGIGSALSTLNFSLSFIKPWLYKNKHKSMVNYNFISGIPLIGSIFLFLTSLWLNQTILIASLIFFFYIIDTGGIHVATYALIKEFYKEKLT